MAARKPISVNLRDLQRVLNEGKPEMPRFSSAVTGNNEEEEQNNASFGPTRYKSSNSRWANEVDEEDFDTRRRGDGPDDKPEPDFSTVRNTDNEFVRLDSRGHASGRNATHDDTERKPEDDVWRNPSSQTRNETSEEEDIWRRPSSNRNADKPKQDEEDNMFNRAGLQRGNSGKKLYVPPSKKFDSAFGDAEGSSEPTTSRFSCLDSGFEMRHSTSSNFESSRTKEIFSMHRRDSESREFNSNYGREAFRDLNRENSRSSSFFGDQQRSGLYVPAYKRGQTQQVTPTPRNSTVHDIFLKAAKITETKVNDDKKLAKPEPRKEPLEKQMSQAELVLKQKREAILRYNRMYEVNHETLQNVESAVNTLINGGHVDIQVVVPEDQEELVPAVLACLIAAKACETCKGMEDVLNKFRKIAPLVITLCERREDDITANLLTEIAKFICEWKLPAISESVYLIEAVFDALLQCDVIKRDAAIQWLEDVPGEVPDRINVILQLLPWKKWLLGETLETVPNASDQESEEEEEEEEDIDIEALVPKPVRISKPMMY
ncbi:hypothetical protein BaOVIS_001580 [Babesia ovis]|uniref:Uncharacterized protein n=1 Tax=Babesia ovis TaxID=5869 RepID=A0A9W5WTG6_BABOV|nr:hypothetical protein BaOVIS_001580 [Babesia ovis]